jgi:RIO-like serine/threonine protein kinase
MFAHLDNQVLFWQGRPDMEGWTQLVTFKQNHVKLTWTFMNIMNAIHHSRILHNDFSNNNIMLHFLINKLDFVYIDVCD